MQSRSLASSNYQIEQENLFLQKHKMFFDLEVQRKREEEAKLLRQLHFQKKEE